VKITLDHIEQLQERATPLARSSSYHGPRHWRDVARVGMALSAGRVDADADVLLLFAAAHDTQRLSEYADPEHGLRASIVVRKMQLPLTSGQLDTLVVALALHDLGAKTKNATIGCCWDADRLTLWRVGLVPHPGLLSGEDAEGFIEFGKQIVAGDDRSWDEIVEGYGLDKAALGAGDDPQEPIDGFQRADASGYVLSVDTGEPVERDHPDSPLIRAG
jgi:uncharacterized protein